MTTVVRPGYCHLKSEVEPLYSNLKVIAVPVLATILHTAPLNV